MLLNNVKVPTVRFPLYMCGLARLRAAAHGSLFSLANFQR